MSAFELRPYQRDCIKRLTCYLKRARALGDPDTAFYDFTRRNYRAIASLENVPFVCLRVPTGGGKTAIAAFAVRPMIEHWLQRDVGVVLWLAPTGKIVEQTLRALRDPRHPYRIELDKQFGGRVTVCNLSSALALSPGTTGSDCVILVTTIQSLRRDDPEGLQAFKENGQLMAHFTNATREQRDELLRAAGDEDDVLTPNLKNLLRMHRPLVIVDEAHNNRTALSFESLRRFNPSAILEITATPTDDVNVLYSVSAAELKEAQMIKLPVALRTRTRALDAVIQAVEKRKELEEIAVSEPDYVRPIVLYQAQNKTGDFNVDEVKRLLIEEVKIDPSEVAICAGAVDEIPAEPIESKQNPVRHIITVQKLREGWDCPFAYVLCSLGNLSSTTAVEQIIGRVLRMPYARRRTNDALNQAYAYATSSDFHAAAKSLEDAIVESGFTRYEAKQAVRAEPEPGAGLFSNVGFEPVTVRLSSTVDLSVLPEEDRDHIEVRQTSKGVELTWQGPPMSEEAAASLTAVLPEGKDRDEVERLRRLSRREDASPAAMKKPFRVPVLAVKQDGQWQLLDDQPIEAEWDLTECNFKLEASEFDVARAKQRVAEIDVNKRGDVRTRFLDDLDRQLMLIDKLAPQTAEELAVWLGKKIYDPYILPVQKQMFLLRMVEDLVTRRQLDIAEIVRNRFRLKEAAAAKIAAHRVHAEKRAYQHLLDGSVGVDMSCCITFPHSYPANEFYARPFEFEKHFYRDVAAMNSEEVEVARFIDSLPMVEYWVRNLEKPEHAFWLRKPHGRFFPDFVAQLIDERILVVEYKGSHLRGGEADDTEVKERVGKLWMAAGNGELLFCMVGKDDFKQRIGQLVGLPA